MLFEPEPSGSKELSGDLIKSKPRIGMRSKTEKKSCPYPKIADSTNYTYDSDEFQFDIVQYVYISDKSQYEHTYTEIYILQWIELEQP